MYFYKLFFIFVVLFSSLQADIKYHKGWNLLGGELFLSNATDEEIWVFVNYKWVLRPNKIEKHQGFWFNAKTNGTLKAYSHIFEQKLPSLYSLYSLVVQYVDINKEVQYARDRLADSYIKIKKDLSFEEFVTIDANSQKPLSYIFKGKFMLLSGNADEIVEYDNASGAYFVSSIILDKNILILIRKEISAKYGVVNKKYTYTRE
ncbi:hypothetical protein MNB_ARC-1_307 [hydrothermal vent metagenome]|uniref:Uncharacterized protein n=1 Tax=hydrothermal vent metagenome TaxID=652676 RepID=A0A3B1E4A8_9ZZZZ